MKLSWRCDPHPPFTFLGHILWTDPAVTLLIELYSERKESFQGTGSTIRKDTLFAEISAVMAAYAHPLSGKQCRAQWDRLVMRLKEEHDGLRHTGSGKCNWKWYPLMLPLFEGTATLEPPFAYCAGSSSEYAVRGSVVRNSPSRSTRTRPPPPPVKKPSKEPNARKPTFRNQALELQERSMEMRSRNADTLVNEVRLMREGTETYRNKALDLLGELVKAAKRQ